MKSYTDLEQSQKLAEILPLESADMYYYTVNGDLYKTPNVIESEDDLHVDEKSIPCWSLASLLGVLPILERKGYQKDKPRLLYNVTINKWIVDGHVYTTNAYDNPIDACVDMIEKLHELNLL